MFPWSQSTMYAFPILEQMPRGKDCVQLETKMKMRRNAWKLISLSRLVVSDLNTNNSSKPHSYMLPQPLELGSRPVNRLACRTTRATIAPMKNHIDLLLLRSIHVSLRPSGNVPAQDAEYVNSVNGDAARYRYSMLTASRVTHCVSDDHIPSTPTTKAHHCTKISAQPNRRPPYNPPIHIPNPCIRSALPSTSPSKLLAMPPHMHSAPNPPPQLLPHRLAPSSRSANQNCNPPHRRIRTGGWGRADEVGGGGGRWRCGGWGGAESQG